MAQKTQEETVFDYFKQYPWLQDFCSYINRSEDDVKKSSFDSRYGDRDW